MTKKSTKTAAKTEQTTTYSTRLNTEEKQILEDAAALTDVSSSKFIRNATLQASSEIINAAAPNDRAVKTSARLLAKQMLELQCEINYHGDYADYETSRNVILQSSGEIDLRYPNFSEEHDVQFVAHSIVPKVMQRAQINKLIKVAQNCPHAFVEALINELQGRVDEEPDFTPRVDIGSIIKD